MENIDLPATLELNNGIRYIWDNRSNNPLVACSIAFNMGPIQEKDNEVGLTHLFEHLLFLGQHDLLAIFDKIGAKIDAYTTNEYLCVNFRIFSQDFSHIFPLVIDNIFNPSFTDKDLDSEKEIIKDEIRGYESDVFDEIKSLALSSSLGPKSGSSITGDKDTVQSYTEVYIKDFQKKYITSKNCVIAVSGGLKNIDRSWVETYLETTITASVNSMIQNTQVLTFLNKPIRKRRLSFRKETTVCITYPCYSRESQKEKLVALTIINALMSNNNKSILQDRLNQNKYFTYSVTTFPRFMGMKNGLFQILLQVNKKDCKQAIQIIIDTLKQSAMYIDVETLESIKKRIASEFIMELSNIDYRCIFLSENTMFHQKFYNDFLMTLDKISVKEIQNDLNKVFKVLPQVTIIG